MAEFNKIRFFLFVSLMIFPAYALDVILSSAYGVFKQKSEIKTKIVNGERIYDGTFNQFSYQTQPGTTKVIVYIIGRSRFVEIIRNTVRATRLEIAWELSEWNSELVFLGIENFADDEYNLISAFISDVIQPDPQNQINLTIETIGENQFDKSYPSYGLNFTEYQGNLLARLRSIPRGVLRPVESSIKEIRLYEIQLFASEARWPVTVVHNEYVPDVDIRIPKYNFKMRHPNRKIHLVILSGQEYPTATRYRLRSPQLREVRRHLEEMTLKNEVLIILGAFNFDWTEVDIVTQIILKHSEISFGSHYDIYTCGFGMFNTIYLNMKNDGRFLLQEPNSNVAAIMEVLLGEEVKQRSIDVYYSDYGWRYLPIPITLVNGRYLREERFDNFSFPWPNQKIAFIVYESTEMNNPIDYSKVWRYVENLKPSGINVVVIETTNFEWYDAHIIAEWIDVHKGYVYPEQIAVLGGGIFDTLFQSATATYNTLFNTKKNDLKRIRNTFVKSGNEKRVFVAKIDNPKFEVWSYPMNTVNGFYEPDLIPDANMFDGRNNKKIFFITTSAHIFHRITAVENVGPVALAFRQDIAKVYPISEWSVFLVGLDNFEERDYHLFAALVKMQTNFGRSLQQFVRTFNYGIGQAMYQYKDTVPFASETREQMFRLISTFVESILRADDAKMFEPSEK